MLLGMTFTHMFNGRLLQRYEISTWSADRTAKIDMFNEPRHTVDVFVSVVQLYMPLPEFIDESVDRRACLHGMLLSHIARWYLHDSTHITMLIERR